jgi:hypothetical protein
VGVRPLSLLELPRHSPRGNLARVLRVNPLGGPQANPRRDRLVGHLFNRLVGHLLNHCRSPHAGPRSDHLSNPRVDPRIVRQATPHRNQRADRRTDPQNNPRINRHSNHLHDPQSNLAVNQRHSHPLIQVFSHHLNLLRCRHLSQHTNLQIQHLSHHQVHQHMHQFRL